MRMKRNSRRKQSYFSGKNIEALGDIWDWLNIPKQNIPAYVRYIAENAFCLSDYKKSFSQPIDRISQVYPRWPVDMRFLLTTTVKPDKKALIFNSCSILMRGYPNILRINDTYQFKSGVEGYVSASLDDGPDVDFLAPLFYREKNDYQINISVTVYLSALALNARPASEKIFKFSEGTAYEIMLKEFLKENPSKTKKDFPYIKISTKQMTALLPTEATSLYQYRAKILNIFPMDPFEKTEIFKLLLLSAGDSPKNSLKINLYVKKNDLNGYIPKKGDFIEGILWMYGSTHFMTGALPTDDDIVE